MPVPARIRPAVLGTLLIVLSVMGALLTDPEPVDVPPGPARAEAVTGEAAQQEIGTSPPLVSLPMVFRPAAARDQWSGFAFDACRAPSQRVMDRWLRTSPFLGVGIYLGGVHRACSQRHLTPGWVSRQTRAGWRLLPLWVGPQASCTGYRWRIDGRPGPDSRFGRAARAGVREARAAVGAARRLGIGGGSTLWYDIEPFSLSRQRCRLSALTFLDAWTRTLHGLGYQSGVYSHVRAGVSLLSRAHRRYARPDRVWYAFVNYRADDHIPRRFVRNQSWMRSRRVHQFVLDRRVRFGGISMRIDWNWVSLGRSPAGAQAAPCGIPADRTRHPQLAPGVRSPDVTAAQCLLRTVGHREAPGTGLFDGRMKQAVLRFQQSRRLAPTGAVDRRTWMALLSAGPRPVLKRGSVGPSVRRLQRTLNAALPADVRVDGGFGRGTAAAVRRYQALVGHKRTGIVTELTWRALGKGTVVKVKRPPRVKARARR